VDVEVPLPVAHQAQLLYGDPAFDRQLPDAGVVEEVPHRHLSHLGEVDRDDCAGLLIRFTHAGSPIGGLA
jgi:hypothetical protein